MNWPGFALYLWGLEGGRRAWTSVDPIRFAAGMESILLEG